MATLTVYPGVLPNGTRCSVLAQDGVTPIPDAGAVVDYSDYYEQKLAIGLLLDYDPVDSGGTPISILTTPVTVTGSAVAGRIVKATSSTQATWQDDTSGVGVTVVGTPSASGKVLKATSTTQATWQDEAGGVAAATSAPPAISTTASLGSVSARAAREDHTHALALCTSSAQGAMSAADKILCNDRFARVYSIHAGAQAGATAFNCNGTNQDWTALNTLLNTTLSAASGARLLWSGTAVSPLTLPLTMAEKFEHDFQPNGGGLNIPNTGTDIVILGPVRANPRRQIFSTAGGTSKFLLPGQTVHPEWYGAKADGATDNTSSILHALDSIAVYAPGSPHSSGYIGGGGVMLFDNTRGVYGFQGSIERTGQSAFFTARMTIRGPGKLAHCTDRALIHHTATPMLSMTANTSFGWVEDVRIQDLTLAGNGPLDFSQCIFMGGARRVWITFCRIQDTAKEGFHFTSAENSLDIVIMGCSAQLNGKGDGLGVGAEVIAAYNPNASQLRVIGNSAYDVGQFVEHTGKDGVFIGNVFRKALFRGVMVHSETHNNERLTVVGNCISEAPTGVYFGNQTDSIGKAVVAANVIYDCDQGVNLGAVGGHEAMAFANYMLGGSSDDEAYVLGPGAHTVQMNTISRVTGSTTGTIAAAGTTTGTLTRGTTTGDTTADTATLVLASATGVSIGCIVEIGAVVKKITNLVGTTATMDSKFDRSMVGANVTWCSPLVVASATGIAVGSAITIVGVTGTKTVTAISGTSVTLDTPADASVTGAAVAHSRKLVIPRGTGISRGIYCTIAGVTGEKKIVDDAWGTSITCTLDTPADAAVTSAAISYCTKPWAYVFRCETDDYYTCRHNTILGAAWTTAVALIRGTKATIGPNTIIGKGQSYGDLGVIVMRDSLGGTQALLRTTDFDVNQPWVYSGVERSYWTAAAWPTTRNITMKVGDQLWYSAPVSGGFMGEVITVRGTWGTLNGGATTANVTSGQRQATLSSVIDVYPGCIIAIAGVTGTFKVETVTEPTKVITWAAPDPAANATVAGAAVSFSAPTAETFGAVS